MSNIFQKKSFWIVTSLVVFVFLVVVFVFSIRLFIGGTKLSEERIYTDEEGLYAEEGGLMAPGGAMEKAETAVGEEEEEEEISQKIIKFGTLNLVVEKVSEAVISITNLVTEKQGFVSDSDIYTSEDETQYGNIEVRVPAQHFEEVMNALKGMAKTVEKESISGVDVTEEYVDLQSRLKNLRIEEEQYQEVLKGAETTEDILKVTDYLFDVREIIERIEGRIRYLENLTDLSTITVYLSEEPRVEVPTAEWKPLTTIKRAARSVIRFFQGLITLLIWVLFYAVPLGIIVWLVVKIVKIIQGRKKGGEKQPKKQPASRKIKK